MNKEKYKQKYPEIEILRGDLYLKSQRKTYASQLTKEDLQKMANSIRYANLLPPEFSVILLKDYLYFQK